MITLDRLVNVLGGYGVRLRWSCPMKCIWRKAPAGNQPHQRRSPHKGPRPEPALRHKQNDEYDQHATNPARRRDREPPAPARDAFLAPCPSGDDHMKFEVVDPVTIMFLLLAGLGLITAVAYGRM